MNLFDHYLIINIFVSILFIISAIRYCNKKNEYKFYKNADTLKNLQVSGVFFTLSTILLLIMFSTVLILFKWYSFLVLIIVIYIFLLRNFIINLNEVNGKEENTSKHFTIFSFILCFLLIVSILFFIWLKVGVYSGLEKFFKSGETIIYNIYDFIKSPNENSKVKMIDGLDELVDIYNDNVNEKYNVNKEKIRNVADNLIDKIIATDSENNYEQIGIGIDEILKPFISSNSDIDKNKIFDIINEITK